MNYTECIVTGIIAAVVWVLLQNLIRGYTGNRIDKASVKVMRSYDYCHFEVCLGSDTIWTKEHVDDLRKQAARLADKAVEQYKIAKAMQDFRADTRHDFDRLTRVVEKIQQKPESEWTPAEKANVKKLSDLQHARRMRYDYDDGFDEEFFNQDWEPEDEPREGGPF